MTWNIRRGKPQPFDDYLLTPGRHIATMQHYDKANVVCDEYEYKQEGALLYYMDLPRKGFEQLYADTEKFMRASNAQHWKLSLTEWEQPLRFNSFTIDGWFPTHVDHNSADNSKLSIIQLMNDDYEGGEQS